MIKKKKGMTGYFKVSKCVLLRLFPPIYIFLPRSVVLKRKSRHISLACMRSPCFLFGPSIQTANRELGCPYQSANGLPQVQLQRGGVGEGGEHARPSPCTPACACSSRYHFLFHAFHVCGFSIAACSPLLPVFVGTSLP